MCCCLSDFLLTGFHIGFHFFIFFDIRSLLKTWTEEEVQGEALPASLIRVHLLQVLLSHWLPCLCCGCLESMPCTHPFYVLMALMHPVCLFPHYSCKCKGENHINTFQNTTHIAFSVVLYIPALKLHFSPHLPLLYVLAALCVLTLFS